MLLLYICLLTLVNFLRYQYVQHLCCVVVADTAVYSRTACFFSGAPLPRPPILSFGHFPPCACYTNIFQKLLCRLFFFFAKTPALPVIIDFLCPILFLFALFFNESFPPIFIAKKLTRQILWSFFFSDDKHDTQQEWEYAFFSNQHGIFCMLIQASERYSSKLYN